MDSSIPLPVVAVLGAVAAAFLTGLFSFINLVLSKELKISDARLAWNDALREDIGSMLAHVETLARLADYTLKDLVGKSPTRLPGFTTFELASFRKDHMDKYLAMNEARHRIRLRLNPGEHQDLIAAIEKMFTIFRGDCADVEQVHPAAKEVASESQKVLRSTWEKVTVGEARFVRTKKILFWFVAVAAIGVAVVLIAWLSGHGTQKSATRAASAPTAGSAPVK